MNIVLFTEAELAEGVPLNDRRARHLLEVLRRRPGEAFDLGIIDGPRGRGRIRGESDGLLRFDAELLEPPPPLFPVTLCVGLARPQTMRRVLRECTTLGAGELCFVGTDRGEAGYAAATLWRSGEYRRHLLDGAEQAFSTRLPTVSLHESLDAWFAARSDGPAGSGGQAVALDNYEADLTLGAWIGKQAPVSARRHHTLIVGSERGWSGRERTLLRAREIPLAHLGERVLRTDTAALVALGILLSGAGYLEPR